MSHTKSHKFTFLFVSSTRSDPHMKLNVKEYRNEDVVLMLPPEKPTIKELGHFQVKIVVMKTIQDILLKKYRSNFKRDNNIGHISDNSRLHIVSNSSSRQIDQQFKRR